MSSYTKKFCEIVDEILTPVTIQNGENINDVCEKIDTLWDTGSKHCFISHSLAKFLNLRTLGYLDIGGIDGKKHPYPKHIVNVILPNKISFKDVEVYETNLEVQGFHFLIGMKEIQKCDLAITNEPWETFFSLRCPAKKSVDFTIDDKKLKREKVKEEKKKKLEAKKASKATKKNQTKKK